MARRSRKHGRRRSSAPRARARRYRRNPGGFSLRSFNPRSILNETVRSAVNAGQIIVGKGGVRLARQKFGLDVASVPGSAVELVLGIVGGTLIRKLSPRFGENFTTGAFVSVEESLLRKFNVPGSSVLGDEDESALDGLGLGGTYDLGDVDLDKLAGYDVRRELGDGNGLGGTYDLGGTGTSSGDENVYVGEA